MRSIFFKIIIISLLTSFEYNISFAQNSNVDSLLKVIKETDSDTNIQLYIDISDIYFDLKKDSSLFYLNKAYDISIYDNNDLKTAEILNKKGVIYRSNNEYLRSIQLFNDALFKAVEANDSLLQCEIFNNVGVAFRRIDDDSNALKYHLLAFNIAKKLNDKKNLSAALNSIGILYTYQRKFDKAIQHFEEAMEIERRRNNKKGIAINLNTIAWVCEEQGEYNKAINFYKKSLDTNIENNDSIGIGICSKDLGVVYKKMKKYDVALKFFLQAKEILNNLNSTRDLAYTLLNLGQLYYDTGNNSLSIKWTKIALNHAEKMQAKRFRLDCYEQLYRTYQKIGYFSFALEYLEKTSDLRNQINEDKNRLTTVNLQAEYELEKNETRISTLSEKNEIQEKLILRQKVIGAFIIFFFVLLLIFAWSVSKSRKKIRMANKLLEIHNEEMNAQKDKIAAQKKMLETQKEELEQTNISKDKFFSIIAHDLRNPFNALLSLSTLMVEDYDDLSTDEKKEMIAHINESAENGYRLLENLLAWARSQAGGLKMFYENFNLQEICGEVIANISLKARNKEIEIRNEVTEGILIYADMNIFMTILRNLISNALKFTPRKGLIILEAVESERVIVISVKDTGIGIKKEKIDRLFRIDASYTRKGTEHESGSGLGLILIKEFVEKHNGTIKVNSVPGKGSTFSFSIPKKK